MLYTTENVCPFQFFPYTAVMQFTGFAKSIYICHFPYYENPLGRLFPKLCEKNGHVQFPDRFYNMDIGTLHQAMLNLLQNSGISFVMCPVGLGVDEIEAPILRQKYVYWYPKSFSWDESCCIVPFMGKYMHFRM